MQRKIAAILAADVAGYSRLIALDEEDTLKRLLTCRAVFEDFIGRGGGRVFNTAGDSVLAEFASAVEALRAAIDIQEAIRTLNREVPEGRQMRFRIGITIGDVVERDGDLLGDGVNIAARLEALAEPGGICISRNMHEQVLSKMAVSFRDLGLLSVKNLPAPIQVFAIDAGDPRATAPGAPHGTGPAPPARRAGRRVLAAAGAVGLVLLGVAAVLGWPLLEREWQGTTHASAAAVPKVYGFSDSQTLVAQAEEPIRSLDHVPFVCAKCQAEVLAAMSGQPNKAVALSDTGAYGYSVGAPTQEEARLRALADCTQHRIGDGFCDLYALNGVVVWNRPVPLPPQPWVTGNARHLPFAPELLDGATGSRNAELEKRYSSAYAFKALALGRDGRWYFRSGRPDPADAARATLELCGSRTGLPCRLVAINDEFVVDPSGGPVPYPLVAGGKPSP